MDWRVSGGILHLHLSSEQSPWRNLWGLNGEAQRPEAQAERHKAAGIRNLPAGSMRERQRFTIMHAVRHESSRSRRQCRVDAGVLIGRRRIKAHHDRDRTGDRKPEWPPSVLSAKHKIRILSPHRASKTTNPNTQTDAIENRGIVRMYLQHHCGDSPPPICVLGSDQEGEGMAQGWKSEGNRRHFESSKAQQAANGQEISLQKKLAERQHIIGWGVREYSGVQQLAAKCRAQSEADLLSDVAHFECQDIQNLGIRCEV